jgi:DNA helicase-2/ATP-dependent DNA helicase PcrA
MDSKNELEKLNKEQKEAVFHNKGPLLIIAGAGTGKTRVITSKIVNLIEKGIAKPEEILAVTFTDKAAEEMEERVDRALAIGYADLEIATFHSFCDRILKERALDIGLSPDFKLLDPAAVWLLIRQNLNRFPLNYYKPLGNPTRFIYALISHFSRCKDQGVYPQDYLEYSESLKSNLVDLPEDREKERIKELAGSYHIYQRLLLENNSLDFGDLIIYCLKLFKERPAVLEEYRKKFKYILVDEFQDTNWAQYELIKLLAAPENNLTVAADDDQSIYKFRGASYNNILQFRKDFPAVKEISLVRNYRSKQNILDLAYKFVQANNPNRLEYVSGLDKKLKSQQPGRGFVEHLHFRTLEEESAGVVEKIINILKKDKEANFNDFAILVRANDSAVSFVRALEKAEIPYQFLASRGLYTKPIILDIISYFKVLDNYYDDAAFFRVLNFPFLKISIEDIMKIIRYGRLKTKSIYESLQEISLVSNISVRTAAEVNFLLALIKKQAHLIKSKPISEILVAFLKDSGYLKDLLKQKEERKLDLVAQFYKKIKDFEEICLEPTLRNFISQLSMEIESGYEGKLQFDPNQGPDMVKIMTIHSAKGLEFKYVFLVNMVDKKFPAVGRREAIEIPPELVKEIIPEGDIHLQEERRLCYVAMTRAKEGLFFTSADDYGGKRKKKLSTFLVEMGFRGQKREGKREDQSLALVLEKKRIQIKKEKKDNQPVSLPVYFSFSQLAAFKKCPLQYKFAYILKIPVKGKAVFSFGKTIHKTLYEFVKLFVEQKSAGQKNLFFSRSEGAEKQREKPSLSFKNLLEIYQKKWINEWYEDKNQKEEYYKLGKKWLKDFYERFLEEEPEILAINGRPALETPFKFKIGDYLFYGRIDRIDKLENGVKIVDYKTGGFKEKLKQEDKEQLLIYQIAAEKTLGLQPRELNYYYLKEGKAVSFLAGQEEKEKQIEAILSEIEEIRKSNFGPAPGWQCQFCDFKEICDYAKYN